MTKPKWGNTFDLTARANRSHRCNFCRRKLTKQICDYPLRDYTGRTCCMAVCPDCATRVEHRNFCPEHAPLMASVAS